MCNISRASSTESEKDFLQSMSAEQISSTSLNHHLLKKIWFSKIQHNQQKISHLTQCILNEEKMYPIDHFVDSVISLNILDRLQIQQKNLIHTIADLIFIDPLHSNEMDFPEQTKFQLIEKLRKRGYRSVADRLEQETDYPWNEIIKINSPLLIEQLTEITSLCQYKSELNLHLNKQITKKTIDFALYLAKAATNFHLIPNTYEILTETKQILGQLLFLLNKNLEKTLTLIDQCSYNEALEKIKHEFNFHLEEMCLHLQDHYIHHYETSLQNPDIALCVKLPIEIAKFILTDRGTINVGIIDILIDIFLSDEKPPINHEINLFYALNLFQRSPALRAEFEKIQKPLSTKTASNDVIRTTLDLAPEESIGILETRLVALIACMSHPRQGNDPSCFAISLAIESLSSRLMYCLKDFKQLLEEGKLTRQIQGVRKDIPFIPYIHDASLLQKIKFDQTGELRGSNHQKKFIWDAPGIQAIFHMFGIQNTAEIILEVIQKISVPSVTVHEMETKEFIKNLCDHFHSQITPSSNINLLYRRAYFGFSAQVAQPLLKVWENTIANMSEAEEGGLIKPLIIKAIIEALEFKLGREKIAPSLFLQRFFLHVQKILYEKIRLQYDPNILRKRKKNKMGGGFVLYQQQKRVDHEKAFRQFILDILLEIYSMMRKKITTENEKLEFNQVFDILTPYIETDEFIAYLLVRYHQSNQTAVSLFSQGYPLPYTHLKITPWITQAGNNSKALLKIYFEQEHPLLADRFISSKAEETLANIIEICKKMSQEEKRLYLANPNKLKPLCILGKHRLPFMAGNPSLANAWQQDYPTKEWIEQFVIQPGREIAHTVMNSKTQRYFAFYLKKNLLPKFFQDMKIKDPEQHLSSCIDSISKIPIGLTIKDYRNHLLQNLQNLLKLTESQLQKLMILIDTSLYQSLESNLKKKLENSAVHFADTNWCKGTQDIHFCFAVNPGTGELQLWEVYANGTHLKALNQDYWLSNQKWEFLTLQPNLILDDAHYLLPIDTIKEKA